MSTSTVTASRTRPHDRRALRVLGWVLRLGLAALFAGAGLAKLGGDAAMVAMFGEIGAGQWLRYVIGACEAAGAVGLLVPALARWAAGALAVLMVGATVTNLVVLEVGTVLTVVVLVALLVVVRLQRTVHPPAACATGPVRSS